MILHGGYYNVHRVSLFIKVFFLAIGLTEVEELTVEGRRGFYFTVGKHCIHSHVGFGAIRETVKLADLYFKAEPFRNAFSDW